MAVNVEAEIRDLKRRVSELEDPSGFELLAREISSLHSDLLAFQRRTERRFQTVDEKFDRLEGKIDGLDRKLDTTFAGLSADLSAIVGDAIREAYRERDRPR